mmetsp:Transcript_13076/g.28133  ORF Transcript_13076/g.28133 Transcript_13076/m.28133 type:complete len:205 (-) Transcript_13076:78-692(-)
MRKVVGRTSPRRWANKPVSTRPKQFAMDTIETNATAPFPFFVVGAPGQVLSSSSVKSSVKRVELAGGGPCGCSSASSSCAMLLMSINPQPDTARTAKKKSQKSKRMSTPVRVTSAGGVEVASCTSPSSKSVVSSNGACSVSASSTTAASAESTFRAEASRCTISPARNGMSQYRASKKSVPAVKMSLTCAETVERFSTSATVRR